MAKKDLARMTLVFAGGASISVVCEDYTITKNTITNELTKISWEGIQGPSPRYVDMDQVVAVTTEAV